MYSGHDSFLYNDLSLKLVILFGSMTQYVYCLFLGARWFSIHKRLTKMG